MPEIRVVQLDDGWMVRHADGRTDQFQSREIAVLVAQHAARHRGYDVTVEEKPQPGIVLDDLIPEDVTEAAPPDDDDDHFANPS